MSIAAESATPSSAGTPPITVRRVATPAEYLACQEVQRRAWGLTTPGYVVPVATMVGAQLHGGQVLGAFLPDGRLVGFSFAFLGRIHGRLCLYSQLAAVDPDYQGRGIGGMLKQAQRAIALSEGLDLMAWAFDPLQAGNGNFNLNKIGATSRTYIVDMYGPRTDALNAGLAATDRLIAEWELREERRPPAVSEAPELIASAVDEHGLRLARGVRDVLGEPYLLLEVPTDLERLRSADPAHVTAWRETTRAAFLAAFAAGYRAVGFVRHATPQGPRAFYLLQRERAA